MCAARSKYPANSWGIPSIHADNDDDLFFGFGYAMAQDRLFQLDYLRRKGAGRLAEILGPDGSELDYLGRIVGLRNVFELGPAGPHRRHPPHRRGRVDELAEETRTVLRAFSAGINAVIEESRDRLPIEFDLLDYRPEPWSPIDCLTIEGEFRWYLTGRFPVIVMPELARRALGDGPLYRAFLEVEADDESILPPGSYPRGRTGSQPVGTAAGDPQGGGQQQLGRVRQAQRDRQAAGRQRSAHRLRGRLVLVRGPSVRRLVQRRRHGLRRHAGRDVRPQRARRLGLHQQHLLAARSLSGEDRPAHPDCFLYDGHWEPARKLEEVIAVKGGPPVHKTIRFSRNGPIVDEVLPPAARQTGPVSLKWLGAYRGGWLTALLGMDRAKSARGVPRGDAAVACADLLRRLRRHGRAHRLPRRRPIPIRNVWERGYRPGWDPQHQWDGLIPFEGMPQWSDPERGWIATANNRPAPEDFPYPLSGTWSEGLRAERIRQMIEAKDRFTREDFIAMQHDAVSIRAQRCLPSLLKVLKSQAPTGGTPVASMDEAVRIWSNGIVAWKSIVSGQRYSRPSSRNGRNRWYRSASTALRRHF